MKHPTMLIRSYFMVKQHDLPELETVVSSSVMVRAAVKCATDGEGDSSESKRGAYEKIASESRAKILIRNPSSTAETKPDKYARALAIDEASKSQRRMAALLY